MENENIRHAISFIFQSVQEKNEQKSMHLLGEALDKVRGNEKLKDPEMFDLFVAHEVTQATEMLAKAVHESSTQKNKHKTTFLYANYGFMESNIQKLCCEKEGSSCSADKSRYLLNLYLNYSITGEVPSYELKKGSYWKPKFGTGKDWMDFCDGLYDLYYGNNKKYLMTYAVLIRAEVQKFRYMLHRWHMELTDGTSLEMANGWDENTENPMSDSEREDFYIVHSFRIGDLEFEGYTPEEDEPFVGGAYVKIPKSQVRRLYMESEEVMR